VTVPTNTRGWLTKEWCRRKRLGSKLVGTGNVVYYASRGGLIKIGMTCHLPHRVHNLARGEKTQLLVFERGAREREKQMHKRFADCRAGERANCEWFRPEPKLLAHIARLQRRPEMQWLIEEGVLEPVE
jgi:hypothetical protein